jgi:two-component system, chemotaxis family, chemotaxis protein CheV
MEATDNTSLMAQVDAKAQLAGSNKMEVLLFSLGTRETFGINVFKVREVTKTPQITRTPNMPSGVEGVISLRGHIIPVVNLARFANLGETSLSSGATMMVTEFNRRTQAFLVHDVDRIIRVDWQKIRAPENVVSSQESLITAITELDDGRLVSILDVEQVLAAAFGEAPVPDIAASEGAANKTVFFADDSAVARKKIVQVLEKMGVKYQQANNGREAWERLQSLADRAARPNSSLSDHVSVILTDAEMPEMDGYVLTKHIKSDKRFNGVPIIMHSSLSSEANRAMGKSVGVDAYVAKFEATALADTLRPHLGL